jgi:tetratricopeptide (TPR) repeat protein
VDTLAGGGGAESWKAKPGPATGEPPPEMLPAPRQVSPNGAAGGDEARSADRAILLGAARTAVKRGDYDQAIARYEEFFRTFGDDPAVRREYAGVLIPAKRLDRAAEEYQRLLAANPNDPELHAALGDLYLTAREYRKAIASFRRALELAPTNLDFATRLGRTYTFDNDVPHALEVYDRYLAHLQPGDENVPRQFPALLTDLEWPAAALPFLESLRAKYPDDAGLLADLVRAYSRLGDREKAVAALGEMADKAPRELALRLALGDTLYQAGDWDLAQMVYEQVLGQDAGNAPALIGTARVAIALFRPDQARGILDSFKPDEAVERSYRFTWAEYHQLVGEYIEAKQIYLDLLCKNPSDYEARLALGALQEFVCEYEKAKAEYSKVPADVSPGRKARLGIASTLFAQRLYPQSADVCQALLAENPGDGEAMARLVRAVAKMDQAPRAVALGRTLLQDNPRNERGSRVVHFALGRVLLDACRNADAAHDYEWLLARPPTRIPAAYYGLARAAERSGNADQARLLLTAAVNLPGGEARNRLLLSDLFAGDFDIARAAGMAADVVRQQPLNLAALIVLADAQQRLALADQHIDEAVKTCRTILAQSPTNVRAHLALARALGTAEHVADSVAEYDELIALDSTFTVPQREKARELYSDHAFAAAAAAYHAMEVPGADEVLHAELAALSRKDPCARALLDLLLRAGVSGKALREEVARLAAAATEAGLRDALLAALADYDARCAEQTAAHLEGEAKGKKDLRNYQAIPVYQSLLTVEPGNEEALFDLGQVYGTLRQTRNELDEYACILKEDPIHREALIAQERASLELDPQMLLRGDLFSQRGRDGLARVDRYRATAAAVLPWGDEDEILEVGFARVRYVPHDDAPLDGNIPFVRVQGKPCDPLLLFAQVNFENYTNRLSSRPTFEAGGEYDWCEGVHSGARAFLDNVVENGETLRQDIYRYGGEVSASYCPTRAWDFGGTARAVRYSDDNTLGELYLVNNVLLSFPPDQLAVVLDADLQTYASSTVFPGPDREDLRGVIHPYFSPRGFVYYEARIEWTQWLSRDYFVHSNQCYYSLQYALGADSSLATYHTFRALANFDIKPWLTVGADATQVLSDVYRATSADAFLVVRFPCCRLW